MQTPVEEALGTMPRQMRWLGVVLVVLAGLLSSAAFGAI